MAETTANFDETWKDAIGNYLADFLKFFYPQIDERIDWQKTPISLDKELEKITASSKTQKRHADKLFQVWLLDNQEIWLLIHIEVQSQDDQEFPERMFIYNYRAYDLYGRPVVSLAILGDERKNWRPNYYEYGLEGSRVRIDFLIVKLLDYEWEQLEESENPFAVVVMAHLKTKVTTRNSILREQWKWNLSRLLYEKGYNRKQIEDLYKVIDLMMTLPEELQLSFEEKLTQYQEEMKMPLLTNIERRALEQGTKTGAKSSSQKHIINLLQKRFGELPETLVESINQIEDISQLDQLVLETISVNSLAEFETLINDAMADENPE